MIVADDVPYDIIVHKPFSHGTSRVRLNFISVAKLPIDSYNLKHNYPELNKKDAGDSYARFKYNDSLATSFYITNFSNGSSVDYKTKAFSACMKELGYKRKEFDDEDRIGSLCGFFGECRETLKNYFTTLYINKWNTSEENKTPKEYYKQQNILGIVVRQATLQSIKRTIGGVESIIDPATIDLTHFDDRFERTKMIKLLKAAARFSVPMPELIVDREVDERYGLKEKYKNIVKKGHRNSF